jgi:hypothetical protein
MMAVEESLSIATSRFLSQLSPEDGLREFENKGRRIRVELRRVNGNNDRNVLVIINGSEEIECINRSVQDVLANISSNE